MASGGVYDEVEIEDMEWAAEARTFYYPCPCGDRFFITLAELLAGEDVAKCPSCSLRVRVIYDPEDVEARFGEEAEGEGSKERAAAVEVH
jgi:diphthamide biosynthesis protein 3